jgi:Poly A polymerase head domain
LIKKGFLLDPHFQKFSKEIPKAWEDVLSVVVGYGFVPTLVGGSVRDFFLFGKVGADWDLEISHPTLSFNPDQWKDFARDLSALGKTTILPYDIIRLEYKSYQFEFSSQRIEHFLEAQAGHKNFTVTHEFNLPFSEAAHRRDFTVNALGFDLKNKILLDPFEGLRHLREKLLVPCSEDFSKDPVRFLRALRFSLKYKLEISPTLQKTLDSMELSYLSSHYLWSEMKKSGNPVEFLSLLQRESSRHPDLKLPLLAPLEPKLEKLKTLILDPLSQDFWLIGLHWLGFETQSWEKYFALSPEQVKRFGRWSELSQRISAYDVELLKGEFESIHPKVEFQKVFDWYFATKQILQKSPELPLMKFIQDHLPGFSYLLTFELLKDVKHIDPPLRAKYQVWSLCQRI